MTLLPSMARTDPWCAYDCYRRFLAALAEMFWGLDSEAYGLVDETKKRYEDQVQVRFTLGSYEGDRRSYPRR